MIEPLEERTLLSTSEILPITAAVAGGVGVNLSANVDYGTDAAWVDVRHIFQRLGRSRLAVGRESVAHVDGWMDTLPPTLRR